METNVEEIRELTLEEWIPRVISDLREKKNQFASIRIVDEFLSDFGDEGLEAVSEIMRQSNLRSGARALILANYLLSNKGQLENFYKLSNAHKSELATTGRMDYLLVSEFMAFVSYKPDGNLRYMRQTYRSFKSFKDDVEDYADASGITVSGEMLQALWSHEQIKLNLSRTFVPQMLDLTTVMDESVLVDMLEKAAHEKFTLMIRVVTSLYPEWERHRMFPYSWIMPLLYPES